MKIDFSITLDDVIGHDDAKIAIEDLFRYLRIKSKGIDVEATGGILFYGYPGTGKTFMINAIHNKIITEYPKNAIFKIVRTGDITSGVGTTEVLIDSFFKELNEEANGRAIILAMDEADEIIPKKDKCGAIEGERVSSLLTQLDGLESRNKDVIILATTNHPGRIEEAFLRSGRVSTHVQIELPTDTERLMLAKKYLGILPGMGEDKVLIIYRNTPRWTGADYKDLSRRLNNLIIDNQLINKDYVISPKEIADTVNYIMKHRKTNFELFESEYRRYKKDYCDDFQQLMAKETMIKQPIQTIQTEQTV